MADAKPSDKNYFSDPLFKWILGISVVVLMGFVAKETLHFSNAPSFVTKDNEVKRESLPGGSRVWLNPNTKFSYGTPWLSNNDRDLWLSGVGYFDLRTWGDGHYVIHTPFADIVATGGKLTVSNVDDKVMVHSISGKHVLRPGPENKFREFFIAEGESYEFNKGVVKAK